MHDMSRNKLVKSEFYRFRNISKNLDLVVLNQKNPDRYSQIVKTMKINKYKQNTRILLENKGNNKTTSFIIFTN